MEMQNNKIASPTSDLQFAVSESYKTIRTNLLFLLSGVDSCKTIMVSSPKAGDGKTTNAINIAIALSQLGKRVLLIDGDLRRPSIHKKLHLENASGLSGVLAGFAKVEDSIIQVNGSFYVLPAGSIPPNPSEMLASAAMDKLLDELKFIYDFIVIDSPPLGLVSDPLIVAPKTEGIVLIVKEKITKHDDLNKVLDSVSLANIRVLGVVLNSATVQEKYADYKNAY